MKISAQKAVLGLVLYVAAIALVIPGIYFLAASAIDTWLGWEPILKAPLPQVLGATSVLIGAFWMTWSYSYLVFVGKGLPFEIFNVALHPTRILVTEGPYAYVRHPGMIGLLFLMSGVAFVTRSLAGIALVPVMAVIFMVYLLLFEEKGLQKRFGAEFDEYKKHVPMLLPRLTHYLPENSS